jgi:hypothetical protein
MSPSPGQPDRLDWRRDHTFRPPERVPWSELAPQFAVKFGRADPGNPQTENLEVFGQNGSGKTHWFGKMYQERAAVTQRPSIIIATKPADDTLAKIGFPIVNTWDQLVSKVHDGQQNLIFWPRTRLMGQAKRAFHETRITELLDRLWTPEADTDIAIDDYGYAEKLADVKDRLEQYLREGRSCGLSTSLLKQRPQGSNRLIQSETHWTVGFKPKHRQDLEWWSELFGAKRDWMPVIDGLSDMKREFVIRHNRSGDAYISWVDEPLTPVEPPRRRRGIAQFLGR